VTASSSICLAVLVHFLRLTTWDQRVAEPGVGRKGAAQGAQP
jgi:hypothetical protein